MKEIIKRYIFFILAACALAMVVLVIFIVSWQNSLGGADGFNKKSSEFVRFTPGVTKEADVIKALGKPTNTRISNGKKHYAYNTASPSLLDEVVFENGVVLYMIENFFGNYKNRPSFFEEEYGKPDLTLYDSTNDTLVWKVFLRKSVAVAIFPYENTILKILFFTPQNKNSFMQTFSKEIGLQKKLIDEPHEIFAPTD